MMTIRNASEYIIASLQIYPRMILSSPAKLRWACRSSVAHSTRVGRLSWLSRRCVSCIRVALHTLIPARTYVQYANITPTHVMCTFARSVRNNCIPKCDIYIHTNSS